MGKRFEALTGMGARRTWVALAVVALATVLPVIAWAETIEIGGDVYSDKCTPCHADYTVTNNPKYTFTHGNHITYQCSACHPEYPHKPDGTITPVMKDCFNCHGLYHGPQGVIASGTCTDCHGGKLVDLRPASHTIDWAQTPHVAPANERLTTECAMCHTKPDCDECHVKEDVVWTPPVPMVYDAGSGCQACHGSPNLIKSSQDGIVSYYVTGLEESAHRDVTCPQCHIDFKYAEPDVPTSIWQVNAGLSCAERECHDHDKQAGDWKGSVHGTAFANGDLTSATCGSCHGGHDIQRLDTEAAKTELQLAGESMCADCHADFWANYSDSYHGDAYKQGATDAPSCWSCHPAHRMLASDDPASTTYVANIGTTCATCHQHDAASETFVENTAATIHHQAEVRATNPIVEFFSKITGGS